MCVCALGGNGCSSGSTLMTLLMTHDDDTSSPSCPASASPARPQRLLPSSCCSGQLRARRRAAARLLHRMNSCWWLRGMELNDWRAKSCGRAQWLARYCCWRPFWGSPQRFIPMTTGATAPSSPRPILTTKSSPPSTAARQCLSGSSQALDEVDDASRHPHGIKLCGSSAATPTSFSAT